MRCVPAPLIWDKKRHQPSRGEPDSCAPVHRRQPALPSQSWRFSGSRSTSAAKRRSALAPALQAAPSLLASLDSQIVRRQRVSAAAMAWNIVTPDFAAIDIGEADDRRTISREQAPATISKSITYKTRPATIVADRVRFVLPASGPFHVY
jgi:hypothetical protein